MVQIHRAVAADAGEIWTLQRAAFVDGAQTCGDPFILPLTESLERVGRALAGDALVLKAVSGTRIVGSVRGHIVGRTGVISRLAVAPDRRGQGIARALLGELERGLRARCPDLGAFTLVVGTADGGRGLYRGTGYAETRRERLAEHVTMVHMRKDLEGAGVRGGGPAGAHAAD